MHLLPFLLFSHCRPFRCRPSGTKDIRSDFPLSQRLRDPVSSGLFRPGTVRTVYPRPRYRHYVTTPRIRISGLLPTKPEGEGKRQIRGDRWHHLSPLSVTYPHFRLTGLWTSLEILTSTGVCVMWTYISFINIVCLRCVFWTTTDYLGSQTHMDTHTQTTRVTPDPTFVLPHLAC